MRPHLLLHSDPSDSAPCGKNSDLPGEVAVDEILLHQAYGEVRRLALQHALAATLEIGGFLIATFFDGDFVRFHARSRKHLTFKALCRYPGCVWSPSHLWYCVAITEQVAALPFDVAHALPVSHHRELLHVRDPHLRQTLAVEGQALSRRELRSRIRDEQPITRRPRGGPEAPIVGSESERPNTPEVVPEATEVHAPAGTLLDQFLAACRQVTQIAGVLASCSGDLADEGLLAASGEGDGAIIALEDLVDRLRDAREARQAD